MVSNGQDYMSCPPLSVLTTDNQPLRYQFATIWGTSAATAQAAWMAAQLFAEYPGIWPETVRALLVHSARWTQKMVSKYNTDDKKTRGRRDLLRICGYGRSGHQRSVLCGGEKYPEGAQLSFQGILLWNERKLLESYRSVDGDPYVSRHDAGGRCTALCRIF